MAQQNPLQAITAELVTAQDQLLALYELSNVMRRQTSLDRALQALAKLTCRTMAADRCIVKLAVPNREPLVVQFPSGAADQQALDKWFDLDFSQARWLIRESEDPHANLLLLPVKFEADLAGVILCLRTHGEPFASPEGKLGQAIANQAAAFLENLILSDIRLENAVYQEELRIASEVQSSLLPKSLPQVAGIELWASSQPAKHVGGDFYDAQHGSNGLLYVCLGDVSGKGMAAALMMATLLVTLRNEERSGRQPGPAGLLRYLYQAAYDELTESGKFATLFLGSFDPAQRLFKFANAGHSPVIFRPKGGPARLLEANNVPVGIFADSDPEEEALFLNPGDLLLIGSDGLNEAQDRHGQLFTIERLLALVETTCDQPATNIGHAVLSAVSDFSAGHPQSDDQTCLVLKGVG